MFFFSSTLFFLNFLIFVFALFVIYYGCNFAKHTPWQYFRLTAMDDQAKAIHAYLQFLSHVVSSFFLFSFYWLIFIVTIQFSSFILSLSLEHNLHTHTHTHFVKSLYLHMYKDILLQWDSRSSHKRLVFHSLYRDLFLLVRSRNETLYETDRHELYYSVDYWPHCFIYSLETFDKKSSTFQDWKFSNGIRSTRWRGSTGILHCGSHAIKLRNVFFRHIWFPSKNFDFFLSDIPCM